MELEVQVDGGGDRGSDLRSLHAWLGADPAVRRSAAVSLVEGSAEPGSMGGLLEAVQLVTENGWSAASFVMTVVTWRQTRSRPPRVTLRRGDVEVTLLEGTDTEVRQVLEMLAQQPGSIEDGE
ncbi:effector-associated constant component EACC1 [Kitasatospora indigofera]|uniref:effector-associated constant component EACC1 n=1 Tax=Kitasatospora indigofera TaxID=67307 RepID=UPI0033B69D9B